MTKSLVPVLTIVVTGALIFCGLARSHADTVSLQPVADTTLFEVAPGNNLGGANFFNAGTAGNGNRNRALMLFDVGDSIPPGSIVTEATLSLDVVRQPRTGLQSSLFSLRRVFQPWGEGVQVPENPNSPGLGAPAAPGEASWSHRFAPTTLWSSPGGQAGVDFSPLLSSTALAQGIGDTVVFESSSALVADIQTWLNQPQSNFGWMLMTESENLQKTARGFASRESGFGPTLTIGFTAVPEPSTIALMVVSLLGFAAARKHRR